MAKINSNYLLLPNSYLFAEIAKKIKAYQKANPKADIIKMGIGDVTPASASHNITVKIYRINWVSNCNS